MQLCLIKISLKIKHSLLTYTSHFEENFHAKYTLSDKEK